MESLIQFFGRLHPMVLHAPIGLLIGLVALEAMAVAGRRPLDPRIRSILAWLAAISAVFSAGAGLVLSLEDSYDASAVQLHQWLGIGVAAGCAAAAVMQQAGWTGAYRTVLVLAAAAIVPAGHFGAGMTHGAGFLTAPFARHTPVAAPVSPLSGEVVAASHYAAVIAPIFERRCVGCHGPSRQKGGLSLHTPDAITKGGKDGGVLVAGDPGASEMVRRLTLPVGDEDHMPPESKAQPTPQEVRAIEDWIKAGASFDAAGEPAVEKGAARAASGPASADPVAIRAMRDALVHVEPVQQGSNLFFVDFSAVASRLSEAEIVRFLEPVREQVAELSLARSKAGDELMRLAAKMPNLTRLNVSGTDISDAGVAALAGHQRLSELVLTLDHLTDAAAASLAGMPALKRVYTWNSGMSEESLAGLRAHEVMVDTGEAQVAKPLDAETEVTLTRTAPAPVAALAADALKPVNTVCPVSGQPVDPRYLVVYKGHVIGFCCPKCPSDFWADPDKFEAKLH